ncbi:MAG: GIY-YIG nuclease family protein [Candidatus Paceibacterota bacterium]|jgi:excinuclease ABC subunit C
MKKLYLHIPEVPGVYFMKDGAGKILYIGKAANLKRRVSSYFLRPHDTRIQKMVSEIRAIEYKEAGTALEALILESKYIKEYQPPFNIREKDDKSFLYVVITKDTFPRVLLVRGKEMAKEDSLLQFGPFTFASSLREALRIMRRIFPWNTHAPDVVAKAYGHAGKKMRPCLEYEIGICPGTCIGAISPKEYKNIIRNLTLFFEGKKEKALAAFTGEMKAASKKQEFEKAEQIKRRLFALQHIQDVALIHDSEVASGKEGERPYRIEGYDISNIGGASAVGSMVVFTNGISDKKEYRKFKIRTVTQADDVGMLREVLIRRFTNKWLLPDCILIDGGRGQVNIAKEILLKYGLTIPLVGLAKGPERKKNEVIGTIPKGVTLATLIKVRDEAHRFAVAYHKKVRSTRFFK